MKMDSKFILAVVSGYSLLLVPLIFALLKNNTLNTSPKKISDKGIKIENNTGIKVSPKADLGYPIPTPTVVTQIPEDPNRYFERIERSGYIVKAKDNRDLGSDYYYNFIFDDPFLLELNSSGPPQTVTSLEIVSYDSSAIDIEQILGEHLTIVGNLDWGYAESRIITLREIIRLGNNE